MNTQTDHEWIQNLKQEDEESIRALWEMVITYGANSVRRYDQEEDIGREAAIAAVERIRSRGIYQYRFQCPFPAYCRKIVVNEVKRRLKKLPPPPVELTDEIYEDAAADNPDELNAENKLIQERLAPCLDLLLDRKQDVINRRYFKEESPQSIADKLDIHRNNVNQLLHRARLDLRECLEQQGFFTAGDVLGL